MSILPILQLDAIPVYVPMDGRRVWVDVPWIAHHIESVDAILTVDWWGYAQSREPIATLAQATDRPWIIDSAHCHGTKFDQGRYFAPTLETFSTHDRKLVTTGEGGFVLGNDSEVMRCVRSWISYGGLPPGVTELDLGHEIGTNAKLSSIAALMGECSLAELQRTIAARTSNAHKILESVKPLANLRPHPEAAGVIRNNYGLVLLQPPWAQPFRGASFLQESGIQNDIVDYSFQRIPSLPIYRHLLSNREALDSFTEVAGGLIPLSPHQGLDNESIGYLASVLRKLDTCLNQ